MERGIIRGEIVRCQWQARFLPLPVTARKKFIVHREVNFLRRVALNIDDSITSRDVSNFSHKRVEQYACTKEVEPTFRVVLFLQLRFSIIRLIRMNDIDNEEQ